MHIGEAAARSGITAKMIRYYESIGLLSRVARSGSGYRTYAESDVDRLRFIRRARELGFSMEKIATLLTLWGNQRRASATVKNLALAQIQQLRTQIADLQSVLTTLEQLTRTCRGDHRPGCPIIDSLSGGDAKTSRRPKSPRHTSGH